MRDRFLWWVSKVQVGESCSDLQQPRVGAVHSLRNLFPHMQRDAGLPGFRKKERLDVAYRRRGSNADGLPLILNSVSWIFGSVRKEAASPNRLSQFVRLRRCARNSDQWRAINDALSFMSVRGNEPVRIDDSGKIGERGYCSHFGNSLTSIPGGISFLPAICFRKKATPFALHIQPMSFAHSIGMSRYPLPLSPPQISQSGILLC